MNAMYVAAVLVLGVSVVMTMTGRGGGNFYVPVLVACGLPMLQAATTSQFILLVTSVTASLLFARNRRVDWKLALVIDPPTDVMALVGGYYAHLLPVGFLKAIFSILLVVAGIFMLQPVRERPINADKRIGYWHRTFGDDKYTVN
ncbi:MAG: sulfite exporter TauE/SafE family protein, partial [Phycisphaerae bacterium]|nr:sulfite exporter TauE/SafE family protein [Phycisphaerae bacterium]